MSGQLVVAQELPWPPSVDDFFPPNVAGAWVTKFSIMVWIAVALLIIYFMAAYRNPKLVPSKMQWIAEIGLRLRAQQRRPGADRARPEFASPLT